MRVLSERSDYKRRGAKVTEKQLCLLVESRAAQQSDTLRADMQRLKCVAILYLWLVRRQRESANANSGGKPRTVAIRERQGSSGN